MGRLRTRPSLNILYFTLIFLGVPWGARGNEVLRKEAKGLFNSIPDIGVQLVDGGQAQLSEIWSERPILLNLFYRRCSGTCSPFLRNLKGAVDESGGLGVYYDVLSLSFDPKDSLEDVGQMAASLGLKGQRDWHFGIADPESIKSLSEAIGFWFLRDKARLDQFDHPSMVAAIREGKVVSVLMDTNLPASRMKDLLYEVKGVFVPFIAVPDRKTLFRCFQIDPKTGTLSLDWGILILLLPVVLAALIGTFIFRRRSSPVC